MPIPKATKIILSDRVKKLLSDITSKRNNQAWLILRSKIILHADSSLTNSGISKMLNIDIQTAQTWRNRWSKNSNKINHIEMISDMYN